MTAQEIKEIIDKTEYEKIFNYFSLEFEDCGEYFILYQYERYEREEVFNHKKKLYCYWRDCNFINYITQWHGDLFSFVQEYLKTNNNPINFVESIHLIEKILGGLTKKKTSWESLKKYTKKIYRPTFTIYDESVLSQLPKCYPSNWLSFGITKEVFDKYEIGYYNRLGQTVIPVRNNGQLIGIRVRENNPDLVERNGKYHPLTLLNGYTFNFPTNGLLYGSDLNRNAIEENKSVILVEGEKSVMKSCSMFKDDSIALGMFGKNLNEYKRKLLKQMGVKTIYYCADADYTNPLEFENWKASLKRWSTPVLAEGFKVYIVADWHQDIVGIKDNIFDTKNIKDFKKIWSMKKEVRL